MCDCEASLVFRLDAGKWDEHTGAHLSAWNVEWVYYVRLETDGEVGRCTAVRASTPAL